MGVYVYISCAVSSRDSVFRVYFICSSMHFQILKLQVKPNTKTNKIICIISAIARPHLMNAYTIHRQFDVNAVKYKLC
jgi:hypothetical protein